MRGGRPKEIVKFDSFGDKTNKSTNTSYSNTFIKNTNACIKGANVGMVTGIAAGAVTGAIAAGGGAVPGAIIGGASGAVGGCIGGIFKYNL